MSEIARNLIGAGKFEAALAILETKQNISKIASEVSDFRKKDAQGGFAHIEKVKTMTQIGSSLFDLCNQCNY
jgi:hypothetical protein